MISERIKNSIVKYLTNQANFDELNELETWIQNPKNEKLFSVYVKINYATTYNMKKYDSEKVKRNLLELIIKERRIIKLKRIRNFTSYAAVIVIAALATTYFLKTNLFKNPVQKTVKNNIITGTDKALLTLGNGSVITLEKGNTYQTNSSNSNGQEIVYKTNGQEQKKTVYNYLTIPRGGQFHVVLSDGTEVWLNSESQLKYPVAFVKGIKRQVELVYGEAYFDVSPSNKHHGAKFKVINKNQEIEVLGTKFNIKAYKDDFDTYTTLVEGKVALNYKDKKQYLTPNQQSHLNYNTHKLTLKTVDVYNEVSWKEGLFSFENKTLKDIMKVLSRWYDMKVIFENKKIENIEFNGILDKNQNIEDILKIIQDFKAITSYKIMNKTVTID